MTKFDGLYSIRSGKPEDLNFVLQSFLLGVYHGDSWFTQIPKDIFMTFYKTVVGSIVTNPKNIVVIACLPEDPNVILGYSVLNAEGTTVHWVYVKKAWRKRGIMTRLLPDTLKTITHLTATGLELKNKLKPDLIFNPFAL